MEEGVVVLSPVAKIRYLVSLTKFQLVVGIDRVCLINPLDNTNKKYLKSTAAPSMITKGQPYFLGTIAKFTAEATCVDASRDGVNVAAGSADMTVQLINTETFQTKLFKGHEAPILNVALDPKKEYILSSSCDGSAKLWKIETSSCIKVSLFYCVD